MTSNWWANKLGQPQPPSTPITYQPSAAPMTPAVPQAPIAQQPSRLPASATSVSRCPGCGSGNYGGATPESRPRCYDCGYPITQSGTGMPGVTAPTGGPVQKAKQISTANNFNPTTIIGKI